MLKRQEMRNETHLRSLLRHTSSIPFVTVAGWYAEDDDGRYIDGDCLAQIFPPDCQHTLETPFIETP